jgi:hypothetical protein
VSLRTVSDLERGTATTPQKQTVRLLADALHLIGPERIQFETGLGRCAIAAGGAAQAESLLRQALEMFHRIGAPEALDLLTELDALSGPQT